MKKLEIFQIYQFLLYRPIEAFHLVSVFYNLPLTKKPVHEWHHLPGSGIIFSSQTTAHTFSDSFINSTILHPVW